MYLLLQCTSQPFHTYKIYQSLLQVFFVGQVESVPSRTRQIDNLIYICSERNIIILGFHIMYLQNMDRKSYCSTDNSYQYMEYILHNFKQENAPVRGTMPSSTGCQKE